MLMEKLKKHSLQKPTRGNTSVRGLGVVVRTPRYKKANIAFWMSIKFSTKDVKELQIGWPVCQREDNRELKCGLRCNSVDCIYILRRGCYENGNQSSGSITRTA
jgi:hypothetical protein